MNPEEYDNQQRNTHHNPLNQVCGACCKEAAHRGIQHNNNRTDDHGRNIIHTEQGAEQLAAGDKAACRVNRKENKYKQRRNAENYLFLFMVTVA